ncbi:invasion associated locus B family protein [Pistricoccus aurantiacus]|uniref:invasion associated locus B family protein n=1 Tax=Pistricoccus aurantiacus TaxID=1883414 RepID=UPI00362E1BAE
MPNRFLSSLCLAALFSLTALTSTAFAQQGAAPPDAKVEEFEDWEVRCPTDGASGTCSMTQLINNPKSQEPLMRVIMAYPPEIDTAAMVFMLPLGVGLAPGLQLKVDDNQPVSFPYQICVDQGCRADLPIEPALLEQMRSGGTATLSLAGPKGERLDLDISLSGFTAASKRIAP